MFDMAPSRFDKVVFLGANFNVEFFEFGGIPFVFGTHVSVEAELAVTSASALSEDDLAFITMVLDGVVEI